MELSQRDVHKCLIISEGCDIISNLAFSHEISKHPTLPVDLTPEVTAMVIWQSALAKKALKIEDNKVLKFKNTELK